MIATLILRAPLSKHTKGPCLHGLRDRSYIKRNRSPRAAVMTFFIALGLRSHEEHNFSGMFGIYHGLAHLSLQSLSEARLPLSEPAHLALERLGELKDEVESVVVDWRQVAVFPRPAVPPMAWYFNALGVAINAKPMVKSPHSRAQMANMERCIKITRIIREMEQWHVPYNYPRADNAQAWLLKSLEGAIARDVDREGNWMLKQSESIELSGRPESTNKKLLPRISVPFGKKNLKMELREATMFDLIPELEARN
ncbi:hypothetical protein F5148DRAFT_314814 [Russula earlei]|uniref:Uncharacterized protein n=1 Tax=Russula earlei TaxID=71964 RepID=A0ACC0U2N6_9AGAM|nr:hypothetical protein F5148DRAFT_314814 [Russula earlei]